MSLQNNIYGKKLYFLIFYPYSVLSVLHFLMTKFLISYSGRIKMSLLMASSLNFSFFGMHFLHIYGLSQYISLKKYIPRAEYYYSEYFDL